MDLFAPASCADLFARADRVGIDVGTQYLKVAFLDARGTLLGAHYASHKGEPLRHLERLDAGQALGRASFTGSNLEFVEDQSRRCLDLVHCTIRGVLHLRPGTRNIIDLGSNSATLIELDSAGGFVSTNQNALCAAGTGSFIDEELVRLGISHDEIAGLPPLEGPPSIASRCAVFAKTDVIHRQQAGHTKNEVLEGLCRSMLRTCLDTLLKGKGLEGPTVLVGGVSLNPKVVRWLGRDSPTQIVALDEGAVVSAVGAALAGGGPALELPSARKAVDSAPRRRPLALEKTRYPSFVAHRSHLLGETEVRERVALAPGRFPFFLGIDIGSTSTKAAVVDREGKLAIDLYRKTRGDPVGAAKAILGCLRWLLSERGLVPEVLGVGTTGSGRKLVGALLGADLVLNEITAHAVAAAELWPGVGSVVEIGGQDAKYMRLRAGRVVDSNMNYVCAAGTGSFVEEQARKLGFRVDEIGDVVLGRSPPVTSDRCTIFMEQDIQQLLRRGSSREEVLAATLYSVIQNYLTKVVGNRKIAPGPVMFMGATARNKGLVAALEQLLSAEIVVPDCCHVMGALGVCIKLRQAWRADGPSRFRGFHVVDEPVTLSEKDCALCTNYCRITELGAAGLPKRLSWGHMCGREPDAKRNKEISGMELMQARERLLQRFQLPSQTGRQTIGLPMSLSAYQVLPLWSAFFDRLGFNLVTSQRSTDKLKAEGVDLAAVEFCYPAKVGLGHVAALLDDERVDRVFLPGMIENPQNDATSRSYFCPMVLNMPHYSRAAVALHRRLSRTLFAPVNFNWPAERLLDQLERHLGKELGASRGELREAWSEAVGAQARFVDQCQSLGREFLEGGLAKGRSCIVLLGRPYVLYDYGVNLRLPQIIASYGHTVIPVDLVPFDDRTREELRENYENMYWHNGQVILNAVELIRSREELSAILLTSFNCGPDSFLSSYAEKSMGDKPLLTLELDEHSSAGGYLTRLEAFFDNLATNPVRTSPKHHAGIDVRSIGDMPRDEEMVIQNNPDPLPSVYAAALRHAGLKCRLLPPATPETYELGLTHMKGTECSPAIASAGAILSEALKERTGPFNVVFPRTCGPCRLGQYANKFDEILREQRTGPNRFLTFRLNVDQRDSFGVDFKLSVFRGLAAIDVLGKMVRRVRPYETVPGSADALYDRSRQAVLDAVESGAPVDVLVSRAAGEFAAVPVDRSEPRPLVGIVGEFFVRADSFLNQDLVRTVEVNGGEAWLVDTTEWQIWGTSRSLPEYGEYGEGLTDFAGSLEPEAVLATLEGEQERLIDLGGELLRERHEPRMRDVNAAAARYVDETCPNEVLPVVGRGILFATRDRVDLLVNTKPFSCLPGNMAGAILNRLRVELGFAFLDLSYEGSGDPNVPVRTMLANLRARRAGVGRTALARPALAG
jgi:predicted CoA-substrate-specific enzyme activase